MIKEEEAEAEEDPVYKRIFQHLRSNDAVVDDVDDDNGKR